MKKLNKEEIIKKFIENGITSYETMFTGDYKKGNKSVYKIIDLYKYLENDLMLANEVYTELLKHENVEVRTYSSAHCLVLGIYINEAKKILEDISNDKNNGIFCYNAEMTLKCWKNGTLKIYI